MIKLIKIIETETIYVDDNWRLTQTKGVITLKFLGITVWKRVEDKAHKLEPASIYTSAATEKNKVGFTT